jgi:hypothetical protein
MYVRRCGLTGQIEICGDNDLLGAIALHTFDQLPDLELIGSNTFDRRYSPVQYVIAPLELASTFEREHV